jgi:hypothetical protein
VKDGDLDAALLQPIPIGHAQGYFLIIVEQGELDHLRHGVSWETMVGPIL